MTRVLIIHFTPPGVVGGVESIIHEHARLLGERGYQVEVAAGRPGDTGVPVQVVPDLNAASTTVVAVDLELSRGVVSPRFWSLRDRLRSALAPLMDGADIVIVHNAMTLHFNLALTAVLWDLSRERPPGSTIAWCHDLSWVNPLYRPRMHEGYPWDLLRLPAPGVTYVVISEERRQELRRLWGSEDEAIEVVPNGIDPARFLRLSEEASAIVDRYRLFDHDAVLLLTVRVTRRKNIEAGIRAVQGLMNRGVDAIFLVSGPQAPHHPGLSDEYLDSLMGLSRELGVGERVVFLARELGRTLSAATVNELYSVADALLFPSAQEGFGLPILEAGLARLPAVVSDIPIFGEVGGEGVWQFDPHGSADTIASVIVEALQTRPSQLYRRVLSRYRWSAIVDRAIIPLLERRAGSLPVQPNPGRSSPSPNRR